MDSETQEILTEARALIVEKGWWPGPIGTWKQFAPALCLSQALFEAARPDDHYLKYDKAARTLGFKDGYLAAVVQEWNDTPGRTKEEVLDLIDRALKQP